LEQTQLEETLKKLPTTTGLYLMKDESGDILYIGKAISIRDRVRWYFGHSSNLSPRKREMIAQVTDIEFIITETEGRALILESILIGIHSPKYNERREHPPLYEREEAETGLSKTFYHQMRKGSTTVLILSLLQGFLIKKPLTAVAKWGRIAS